MQLNAQSNQFGTIGSAVGVPAEPTTFITPLVFASGNLRQMVERLRRVSDRLVGPLPPATGLGSAGKLASEAVFDEVRERAEDINQMISEVDEMLSRIERALP